MNNKLTMLLAAGALVVGAQSSKALTFSDADTFNGNTGQLIAGGGGSFNSTFNIIAPDSDPGTFTVASGYGPTSGFTFTSNPTFNTATDTIVTHSGSMDFWFRVGPNADYSVNIEDLTLTGNGNGTTVTKQVNFQGGLSVNIEAALQSTGQVTYTITNNGVPNDLFSANVILDYAYLTVDADRRVVNTTPDGGATAMLLGAGAIGLAGLRRKLS